MIHPYLTKGSEIAKKLIDNGYQPIPIPLAQKGPRIPDWQNRLFESADFYDPTNIGIRCGDNRVAALDIDVLDAAVVRGIIEEWEQRHPGTWMQRVGKAPKTLLPFRFSQHGERKRQLDLGDLGKIEVLATGQQFVAFGIHPDTQAPYTWLDINPTDGFLGVASELPVVQSADLNDFLMWAKTAFASDGEQKSVISLVTDHMQAAQPLQEPDQPEKFGRFQLNVPNWNDTLSEAEASELLGYLDPDMPYESWLRVLMALHDAGEHLANLAVNWSARGNKFKPGEVEAKWHSFSGGGGVSWATVAAMAKEAGANLFEIAKRHRGLDFSPIEVTSSPSPVPKADHLGAPGGYLEHFRSGVFRASELEGQPVPERVWHVDGLIPGHTVTLFSGDGGTGKSLCSLQLAVSTVLGCAWFGLSTRQGKAVYMSAEDDRDELHRRLHDICTAEETPLANLNNFVLRSLAGEDALFANLSKGGTLQASPLLEAVDDLLAIEAPQLLVLDTLADFFPGNENDRAQARQFIGMLRGLALRHRCAVVMLAHPSLAGMASGTGTSGSTGWNNSVRSRLYLNRVVQDGYEANPDARLLRTMKSNYGKVGGEIALTWRNGVFVADAPLSGLDRKAASAKAERVFLKLLREFTDQGRNVNHSGGPTYAPKLFYENPKSEGCTKQVLRTAMESLLAAGKIKIAEDGPPSKRRKFLYIPEAHEASE